MLEKDEDQLDQWCEKLRSITGHILSENCLLKHAIEGKVKGRIEVTGRRWQERKQLLDELRKKRRYCNLKNKVVDRTLWRIRLGRGHGPVADEIT